jgi:hypothetical protein
MDRLLANSCLIAFMPFALSVSVAAQVAPAATGSSASIFAGALASAFEPYPNSQSVLPGYPTNKLLGIGAFADLNFKHHWGIEGEGRWLIFREVAQIHETTYLLGPRAQFRLGRLWLYGKALYGEGYFYLPYGSVAESAPVLAFGCGADYRLNQRISVRVFDGEYQKWINFQNQGISPLGASVGLAYRIR